MEECDYCQGASRRLRLGATGATGPQSVGPCDSRVGANGAQTQH